MTDRPLITFALFAYNQERLVREAIEGAFAQTYSPLEIILSDDFSSDKTFEIMQEMARLYVGPHRVKVRQSTSNRGLSGHLQEVVSEAEGQLIVLAAGDDISLPERTGELANCWINQNATASVIYSDFEAIDGYSRPVVLADEKVYSGSHSLMVMASGTIRVLGATCAITKNVFEDFPPIMPTVIHEDRVLPYRALLLGGTVSFINRKMVCYRVVGGVSRTQRTNAVGYLREQSVSSAKRTLPDACQRLIDTIFAAPDNRMLRHACESTISDNEAKIDLACVSGMYYEAILLKWLFKGARAKSIIKHYLKFRFIYLFSAYYRIRYE